MDSFKHNNQFEGVHVWFEQQVDKAPDAIAIVSGMQQYSYRELNHQANQLARYLKKLDVKPETLIGICVERSPIMIVALLAVLKAGGAYVPIDPTYPRERVTLMLEDSQVPIVLTQQQHISNLPTPKATIVCLDTDWPVIAEEKTANLDTAITGDNLAYIIYTSGSTGKPKGVMIEHHALANFVQAIGRNYEIIATDRVLQFASVSFDVAVEEIFVTLAKGATLILRSQDMLRSIPAFLETCKAWDLTVLNLPTAFWHKICAELPQTEIPTCVRLVVIGSERAIPRWLTIWQQHALNHVRLINAYGPTEATVGSTLCDLAGPHAVDTTDKRILPIGKPIDHVQIYVLNPDLQPVGVGVTGELYIAGAGLARGYLNRPDLTAVRFIYMQCGEGQIRLYRTGDLVRYREDDHLEFLGRSDHQEKIRGFRIELNEIETILEQHSNVQQALVLAREDVPGDKRLVAYIVLASSLYTGNLLDKPKHRLVPHLRSYLRGKLPSYMVPSSFVLLNSLPLSPNGKVDRRALPAPTAERPALDEIYVAPCTPLEQTLAQLWSAVLGIAEIGVNDNFFELGGDSLQTTQLISQIEKNHQVVIPLLDFFKIPTIRGLAILIQEVRTDQQVSTEHMTLPQLQAQVVLEASIQPQYLAETAAAEPKAIFLTGSTGFVGAFLLHELLQQTQAKVYCLVRARHFSEVHQKICTTLERYFNQVETYYSRIIPVIGDLAQPRLGLTEQRFQALADSIDVIYHCGANVNLLYPYTALRNTNVIGTHEILRLASYGQPKRLHYLSTLDVFESVAKTGVKVFHENDSIDRGQGISSGYAQSKWIAEQLVKRAAERGLSVCIYRPGMVTGHSQSGHSNTADVLCRFVKSMIQLRQAPDLDLMLDMTPVDYVSRAIVQLSLQSELSGQTFHLVNPNPVALSQLVNVLCTRGFPIQRAPYLQWQAKLKLEPNALSPLAALLTQANEDDQRTGLEMWLGGSDQFDCTNTHQGLQNSITCPSANPKLVDTYLNYFIQSGFIQATSAYSVSTSLPSE
ncbi:MAG: amino acid adenylation domain-containing protein [Cyanobacteria bacterium J06639_16]